MNQLFLLAGMCFVATSAFAHGSNDLIVHGYVIDNACAGAHKNDLKEFVKKHDKMCLMKADCAKAGYSIYSEDDGQLYKFDEASNQTVAGFLKDPNNRTDVVIIAEKNGENLMIESIKNRRIVK